MAAAVADFGRATGVAKTDAAGPDGEWRLSANNGRSEHSRGWMRKPPSNRASRLSCPLLLGPKRHVGFQGRRPESGNSAANNCHRE